VIRTVKCSSVYHLLGFIFVLSVQNGVLQMSDFGKVRTEPSLNALTSVLLGNSGDLYSVPLLFFKIVPLPRCLCLV